MKESICGVCRISVVYNLHVLGAFPLMLNQLHPFESGANEMERF